MSIEEKIAGSVCRIKCGENQGTGFFISENLIVTCLHVINNCGIEPITVTQKGKEVKVSLRASCSTTDLAVLDVLNGFKPKNFLLVRKSTLSVDTPWKSFGHPANDAGTLIVEPLKGTIEYVLPLDEEFKHDVTCDVAPSGAIRPVYKGFSGSPMVNVLGEVIAVLRYNGTNHLHAVSIKRAAPFLYQHFEELLPDELDGFENYADSAFMGFEPFAKQICQTHAKQVMEINTPTRVMTELQGNVFYPHKKGTLDELIKELKKDLPNNSLLWQGWLELLSHVAFLQGKHRDINTITIKLSSEKIYTWLGLASKNIPGKELNLRFFWTDKEHYLEVLSLYIHGNLPGLSKNTCYIFNSKSANFGGGQFKPNFKKNIISSISYPNGAGPGINKGNNYGLLSLRHLNDEVKHCLTVDEATKNLERLFKDAIEQS